MFPKNVSEQYIENKVLYNFINNIRVYLACNVPPCDFISFEIFPTADKCEKFSTPLKKPDSLR